MLWVEVELHEELLPQLFDLVHATDLKWNVEHHMHETQRHVNNLRRVFSIVGEPARAEETPALPGLRKEHDAVLKLIDEDREDLLDIFHAGAIAKTEHHEIASYSGLVHLAKALGVPLEAVTLLRENMEQDAHALEQVEHSLAKLLAEKVESGA